MSAVVVNAIQSQANPETGWSVWGQRSAVATLHGAIQRGPGHAYIFSGPAQSGRRRAALEFARALCCPNPGPTGLRCGACSVCGRIDRGVFPDVTVFDLESQAVRDKDKSRNLTLAISTVREVTGAIAYRPAEAPWRVVIVDDAETMQETAQEAFLKTLEEPPDYVVLILLATDVDTLLPTILSRCRIIRFGYSSPDEIHAGLLAAGADPDRASRVADVARGSMGWAFESANDNSLVDERDAETRDAYDFVLADAYRRMVRAVLMADEFSRDRGSVFSRLHLLQAVWRSALYANQGISTASSNMVTATRLEEFRRVSIGDLVRAIRAVDTCIANLEANVRPRLALESMVIAWPRVNQ